MIDWNQALPTRPAKAVASGLGALVVLLTAGWAVYQGGYSQGKDKSQDQLAAFKAMNEANIPEITKEMQIVDKSLRESLAVFSTNKELAAKIASYEKQIAEASKAQASQAAEAVELRDRIKIADEEVEKLERKIAIIVGESRQFSLKNNQAERVIGGFHIGISESLHGDSIMVDFANNRKESYAGDSFEVAAEGKICRVTLISLESIPASADFDLACKNAESSEPGKVSNADRTVFIPNTNDASGKLGISVQQKK